MKPLKPRPNLTEETYRAILETILDGSLPAGTHIVQEQIAQSLEVSRQPVQQAMTLLRREGMLIELGRRGLFVAPLDPATMRQHYEIRATLDALAARLAANRAAQSPAFAAQLARDGEDIIASGQQAIRRNSIRDMVKSDVAYHHFIYIASGNPLIASTAEKHWQFLRRAMAEVLRHAAPPPTVWKQHSEILAAITSGDAGLAEKLATAHVVSACDRLSAILEKSHESAERAELPHV